ncbi:MAG: hypothetical protein M1812_005505 [Candelaria pacifica]|nr:MAG: hypothetical protein M1812_005505 [Candelaria pacifica]
MSTIGPRAIVPSGACSLYAPPPPKPCYQQIYLTHDRTITPIVYCQEDISFFRGDPYPDKPFPFLKLPSELRNEVYRIVLFSGRETPSEHRLCEDKSEEGPKDSRLRLLRANRQIHEEATVVLYGEVTFLVEISESHIHFLNHNYSETEFNFGYLSLIKKIHIEIESIHRFSLIETTLRDNVRNVCMQLADYPPLRRLSIEFVQNEYHSDNSENEPDEDDGSDNDWSKILEYFGRLRNIKEVEITAKGNFKDDKEGIINCVQLMSGNSPVPAPKKTEKMFRALLILDYALKGYAGRLHLSRARNWTEIDNIEGFKEARKEYLCCVQAEFNQISQARSTLCSHDV